MSDPLNPTRVSEVDAAIRGLPKRAKRTLLGALRNPAETRLAVTWYEYPAHSNFDTFNREKLRSVAEAAGLVEYHGAPYVTALGHAWWSATSLKDKL